MTEPDRVALVELRASMTSTIYKHQFLGLYEDTLAEYSLILFHVLCDYATKSIFQSHQHNSYINPRILSN